MNKKFIFLFVLAVILYLPALRGDFCFDDEAVIIHNPLIQNLSQGTEGIHDVWSFQPSRFLTNLTYAVNFYFHKLDVFGYHLVNLIIHLFACFGVWRLTRLILQIKGGQKTKMDVAFWAALLFLVHPVATTTTSYIAQRSAGMVALFYVWSIIYYLQARISSHQKDKTYNFIAAFGFALLSLLSKETGVTLPLAWILVDYYILNKPSARWLWGMIIAAILMVAGFFKFNFKILLTPVYSQSHHYDYLTLGNYLLTQLHVLVVLLKLIFVPIGLNLDYDFPMSQSLLESMTGFSFLFLASLLSMAWVLRKNYWAFSFAIVWFFVSFLPHILPPRSNVIAEHKLYLTLVLFIPLLIYGIFKIMPSRFVVPAMVSVVCIFSVLTFQRNILWSDPILIWKDTIAKSPNKARPYINLGLNFLKKDQLEEALAAYQKAIALEPLVPQAYIYSSEILYRQNKITEAAIYAQKAIDAAPLDTPLYAYRGMLLMRQNKDQEALADFSYVIETDPEYWDVYKSRAMVYIKLHKDQEALKDMNVWLKRNPKDIDVLSQRADIYFRFKEYKQALNDYNQLILLKPIAPYYYNRSVLYEILGDKDRMQKDRQKARELGFNVK